MKHVATAALFAAVVTSSPSTRVDRMAPGKIWRLASELRHDYGPRAKRIALREAVRAKWNDQPSLRKIGRQSHLGQQLSRVCNDERRRHGVLSLFAFRQRSARCFP
jgi:hypothetical protein